MYFCYVLRTIGIVNTGQRLNYDTVEKEMQYCDDISYDLLPVLQGPIITQTAYHKWPWEVLRGGKVLHLSYIVCQS